MVLYKRSILQEIVIANIKIHWNLFETLLLIYLLVTGCQWRMLPHGVSVTAALLLLRN